VSLWTQYFSKNKSNTIENTAVVRSSGWSILLFFAFLGVLFAEKQSPSL
jgi:hypothetical protein